MTDVDQGPPFAHQLFVHRNGDKCVWIDGENPYWFVPLDAGGEGYDCPHEHPTDVVKAQAWDEGYAAGMSGRITVYPKQNPYRKGASPA